MATDWDIGDEARALHRDALVCDMTLPFSLPGDDALRARIPDRLQAAGVDFVSLTVEDDGADTLQALRALKSARAYVQSRPDQCVLVRSADGVVQAKAAGKLAVSLHFQGTYAIGRDLDLVETFYALGIRHMLLAYNQRNFAADGCHEPTDAGLSRFGRDLVRTMNEVGMLVDVSHTGYRSSMDAIECSERPVVITHGNVHALHAHPRCYRDDQIKAVAASGGVFGLTTLNIFTGDPLASIEGYVRQIDYVVQLVGPDHVGFGFDWIFDLPASTAFAARMAARLPKEGGYSNPDVRQIDPEDIPRITQRLLDRGYPHDAVRKILGGNWLRMMRLWK